MATVVEVLLAAPPTSSTPRLTLVMAASVVSGSISEMDPTSVVLPTANPPATTILTGRGTAVVGAVGEAVASECLKAIEHPFEKLDVRSVVRVRLRAVGVEQAFGSHVAHEHADDAERHPEVGGDLGDRQRRGAHRGD